MQVKKIYSKRLKKDVWSFDFRYEGKRHRQSGFPTKADATTVAGALRTQLLQKKLGLAPVPVKVTLVQTLVHDGVRRLVTNMTLKRGAAYAKKRMSQANVLVRFGTFVGMNRRVIEIDSGILADWAESEQGRGLSRASVRRGINTIRSTLRFGVETPSRYPDLNTFKVPRTPPGFSDDDERERVLSPTEIKRLGVRLSGPPPKYWRHPASWRDVRDAFHIMLGTGLRVGDTLELKWADVNAHFETLRVRMLKTGRELLLPLAHTARLIIERRKADGLGSKTHIFVIRDHTVRDGLRNASKEVGIAYGQGVEGGWTIHDVRRTFLTWLLQAGIDLATVRDMAGHSSVAVTSRYLRSTPDSKKKAKGAAEALARIASRKADRERPDADRHEGGQTRGA